MTERCPLCGGSPVCVACGLDAACHEHFHAEATQRARPIVALIGEVVGDEEKYGALQREILGEALPQKAREA